MERIMEIEESTLTCSTCNYEVQVKKATVITASFDPEVECDYDYWVCPKCQIVRKNMIPGTIHSNWYGAFGGVQSENPDTPRKLKRTKAELEYQIHYHTESLKGLKQKLALHTSVN
jgi:hypothetical protein